MAICCWLKFVIFCLFCQLGVGLRILMFPSSTTKSHYGVANRLSCSLKSRGHEVTMVNPIFQKFRNFNKSPCNVTQFQFYSGPDDEEVQQANRKGVQDFAFAERQFTMKTFKFFNQFMEMTLISCKNWTQQNETLDRLLLGQKFDIVIANIMNYCPFYMGSFTLGLPVIWYSPGNYIPETISGGLEMPSPTSYVPNGFLRFNDQMSFLQRLFNSVFGSQMALANSARKYGMAAVESEIFKINPSDGTPGWKDSRDIPLALINGEGIIDYPRPQILSVVYMGELSDQNGIDRSGSDKTKKTANPSAMTQEWIDILKKPNLILFSFGTVADTDKMPEKMKQGYIEAFGNFRNYTIIWKVTTFFHLPPGYEHIHLSKWVPQRDVLASPNLRLFITHGGYNSLLETCQAGVPMIVIPLFADQAGNARRSERLGFALRLDKTEITEQTMTDGLNEVLSNDRYRQRAKKIAEILSDTIRPNEDLLAHHVEMAARHYRRMPRQTMAQRLNWFQYYSLDILFHFSGASFLAFRLTRKLFGWVKKIYNAI